MGDSYENNTQSAPAREIDDLRDGAEQPTVEVVRTLDPEPREPFVSLSRIFLGCGITPIEGLLRFNLDPLAYDLTLGGLAPFLDIWVPLALARSVASHLDRLDELSGLLEWETRAAWSVQDKEEGGVVHNWKIGSDRVDPQEYSTALMLSTPFPRLHLLPPSTQIRTLLSSASAFLSAAKEGNWEALWARLTEWAVREYEGVVDSADEGDGGEEGGEGRLPLFSPPPSDTAGDEEEDLAPFFAFTTLTSLLALLALLPSTPSSSTTLPSRPPQHLSHLPSPVPSLSRAALLPTPSNPSPLSASPALKRAATLYLLDALSRLVAHSLGEAQLAELGGKKRARDKALRAEEKQEKEEGEWRDALEARLSGVEEALAARAEGGRGGAALAATANPAAATVAESAEVKRLRRDLRRLEGVVARLGASCTSTSGEGGSISTAGGAKGGWASWISEEKLPLVLVGVFVLGLAVGVGLARV
ncbi:hypothetical protein JCM8097_008505 [Rhodosporidiobolus ruineniae]